MSRLLPPGQLWLYRTKPKEDELFSSWIVRLAHGNEVKLHTFSKRIVGLSQLAWTHDLDRNLEPQAVTNLSTGTAVPEHRIQQMSLSAYVGTLWAEYFPVGPLNWIIPSARLGFVRARHHAMQYCRQCLCEDEEPYFRRRWRLAFNVVCGRHRVWLQDECPHCGAPVEFHTHDYGRRLLTLQSQITVCAYCEKDFRETGPAGDEAAPDVLLGFQSAMSQALDDGYNPKLPGGENYSFLAFEGIRIIVLMLCSKGPGGLLRYFLDGKIESENYDTAGGAQRGRFEFFRNRVRGKVLEQCHWLVEDWPDRFVQACHEMRVTSSAVETHHATIPCWLEQELRSSLFGKFYSPSQEERKSVEQWIERNGGVVSNNAVRRLLGMSHTSKVKSADGIWFFRRKPRG